MNVELDPEHDGPTVISVPLGFVVATVTVTSDDVTVAFRLDRATARLAIHAAVRGLADRTAVAA